MVVMMVKSLIILGGKRIKLVNVGKQNGWAVVTEICQGPECSGIELQCRNEIFFFSTTVQIGSGPPSLLYNGYRLTFSGINQKGRCVHPPAPPPYSLSSEIRNE